MTRRRAYAGETVLLVKADARRGPWESAVVGLRLSFLVVALLSLGAVRSQALDWKRIPGNAGHRIAPLTIRESKKTVGFTSLDSRSTGLGFTNTLGIDRSLTNHILMNGSGVALGDVDGDGWVDIFLCGLNGGSALYRNLGGWQFTNVTYSAGVACSKIDATGAVFADVDGDGDLDLLVGGIGSGVKYFVNDGTGHFTDRTQASGLASSSGTMSLALADYDGDGDLDLYVVNYRSSTVRDGFQMQFRVSDVEGRKRVTLVNGRSTEEPDLIGRFTVTEEGGLVENGEADVLYRNEGNGTFKPMGFTEGTFLDAHGKPLSEIPYDWGLSVQFRDFDGDGLPDLYVCNDLISPDRFWKNIGGGKFQAFGPHALRKTSWFSMGVDVADINRDGLQDFVVLDMLSRDHRKRMVQENTSRITRTRFGGVDDVQQTARTTLFLGRGSGEWAEIAGLAGLAATDWSWCPVFLDVDLDGYEDLLITTGFERDVQDLDIAAEIAAESRARKLAEAESLQLRRRFPSRAQPNLAFRNRGDLTFEEVGKAWGFDLRGVSQGMAMADLDQDGDMDVVINNLNGAATLLRNEASGPRVMVRAEGRSRNSRGIGARVRLVSSLMSQAQELISGGRYLSSDDPARAFACVGDSLSLDVTFRSGAKVVIPHVQANHAYVVVEPEMSVTPLADGVVSPAAVSLWFEDWSQRLDVRHQETPFDDLERQPLLPRLLSQTGPGLLWYDLDHDGWTDLVMGGSRGGSLTFLKNDNGRGFARGFSALQGRLPDDSSSILATRDGMGAASDPILLRSCIGSYERQDHGPSLVINFSVTNTLRDIAASRSSPLICSNVSLGCLAAADVDGDGWIDLFAGGRVVPGKFPIAAPSFLWRGRAGGLDLDPVTPHAFATLGLVTGAVFSQLDQDGSAPSLVVAREWNCPAIWKLHEGRWIETTHEWGLDAYRGCWNSVAVGDFDDDGLPDLVLGNLGRNHPTAYRHEVLVHGDFDDNEVHDVLLAHVGNAGALLPSSPLDLVSEALPFLKAKYPWRRDYAAATLPEILGDAFAKTAILRTDTYDSMLFLNRGGKFMAVPLPVSAQFTPVFGISVADFDGDGHQDLFLAQNDFDDQQATDRSDAGLGLLLRGDGKGNFERVAEAATGIRIYGAQRAAAAADFDHDGRVDLAVSQNAGALRLFRNTSAKPGLRVRLVGAPGNVDAVGATCRAVYASKRRGPLYGIHRGTGYQTQQDDVVILGEPEPIVAVEVRWGGNRDQFVEYPRHQGSKEETLSIDPSMSSTP